MAKKNISLWVSTNNGAKNNKPSHQDKQKLHELDGIHVGRFISYFASNPHLVARIKTNDTPKAVNNPTIIVRYIALIIWFMGN